MVVNPNEVYQRNQITTARPEELTMMLYNGALRFVLQAKVAIEKQDLAKAHSLMIRTQEIMTELMLTLNPDYEISESLLNLYDYMKRRLIDANIQKDIAILEEIENMIVELKTTWGQAMKLAKQ